MPVAGLIAGAIAEYAGAPAAVVWVAMFARTCGAWNSDWRYVKETPQHKPLWLEKAKKRRGRHESVETAGKSIGLEARTLITATPSDVGDLQRRSKKTAAEFWRLTRALSVVLGCHGRAPHRIKSSLPLSAKSRTVTCANSSRHAKLGRFLTCHHRAKESKE